MTFFEIALIGVALAMDAFAITLANCTAYGNKLSKAKGWLMPTFFAIFQFLMPVIGFYLGSTFADKISGFAGYVVAGVFFILALKIVVDNLKGEKEDEEKKEFSIPLLILQAVATSIDALIIGVTFSVNMASPFLASLLIGAVTFLIVAIALVFGKTLGKILGKYAEWVGAVILFAIAVKNLVQAIIS
jgi:putative Mn2+ efflux pump MntP